MKVNEYGDTIIFKSDDDYYFKEEAGIKPNTVRFPDNQNELEIMQDFFESIENNIRYIEIHNSKTPSIYFKRMLRDISTLPYDDFFIFSWFHEEDGVQTGYNAPIRDGKSRHWMKTRGRNEGLPGLTTSALSL